MTVEASATDPPEIPMPPPVIVPIEAPPQPPPAQLELVPLPVVASVPAIVVAPAAPPPAPEPVVVPSPEVIAAPPSPVVPDPDLETDDVKDGAVAKGDDLTLPRKAFNGRMSRERAKGRRAAEERILAPIMAAGFATLEEALEYAKQHKHFKENPVTAPIVNVPVDPPALAAPPNTPLAAPAPLAAPPSPAPVPERTLSADERKSQRAARQAAAQAQADSDAEKKRAASEIAAAQARADSAIARTTVGYKFAAAQVVNVDFALANYERHVATLDADGKKAIETAEGFAKYLAEQRATNPYLFVHAPPPPPPPPVLVPANTGVVAPVPPPPGPGGVTNQVAPTDVRRMTPEQRAEYHRKHGIKL